MKINNSILLKHSHNIFFQNNFKILKNLSAIFIIFAVFTITRQFPLNLYGFSGTPKFFIILGFLFGFPLILKNLIYSKNKTIVLLSFCMLIIICIHSLYSLFTTANPLGVLRFFFILILIILAYYLKLPKYFVNWFYLFTILQSLFLIIFEIYLVFFSSPSERVIIRQFFLNYHLGDVYTYNNYFFRIQILGNPLIPVAFFLSVYSKKNIIIKIILFLGVLISANFAFYIATFLFLVGYYTFMKAKNNLKLINNFIKIFTVIILTLYPMMKYVNYILSKKAHSMSVRCDQFNVLINDMSGSILTILFGKGLGHIVNVRTSFRDYSKSYYFELQTIYVLNQLGLLAFIYYFAILFIAYNLYQKEIFYIYLCYIIYAITNPYILDVTHIVVILTLNILNNRRKYEFRKSLCNNYYVQAEN